jgi:hypothetical protein
MLFLYTLVGGGKGNRRFGLGFRRGERTRLRPAARRIAIEEIYSCCNEYTYSYPAHTEPSEKYTEGARYVSQESA